jgi:DNA repair exonuclease SbcCD ATPase subunit
MKSSILVLLAIAFVSCEHQSELTAARTADPVVAASSNATQNDLYSDPRSRMIKTADYRFKVRNLKTSLNSIEAMVTRYPAHVASSNTTLDAYTLEASMTIRVQSEYFTALLKEIDSEAEFTHHRKIDTDDVSKQFVDLESRLKTKLEVQGRYKDILRTKAGKIEELLAAEKQIGDLQEEIEATVSKLNYLKDQVAYSTIRLEFYENVADENLAQLNNTSLKDFKEAFFAGLDGSVALMLTATRIWPVLILAATGWILYKRRKSMVAVK